ncbi:unnamed protein product [Anisakis simplex]|uniref:Uncharacterized protein n=1 Tax=Anisakis simplex TaxID=6269 RepID=A0A0M3J852_ANISI|nr:unnamed protein product [Anisakis simplex]
MSDDSSTEGSSSKVPLKRFGSPVNGGRLDGTPNKKRAKKQSESELAVLSGDDNAEQQATSQPPRISPGEMLTIVQNINQHLQKNNSLRKRRFSSFTDYDSFDLPANISSE